MAVLAELVARRARGALITPPTTVDEREAVDPVCGMTVLVSASHYHLDHEGTRYWFCAPGCRAAFAKDPAAYLTAT